MSAVDEIRDANKPWDGQWFVPVPKGQGARFYTIHQFTAVQLLRRRRGLTNWAARFLQTIATRDAPLTAAQEYWLNRLTRDLVEGVAA